MASVSQTRPKPRFRGRPDSIRSTWKLNNEHVITKERGPFPTHSSSTYASFGCTCGWKDRTASGVKNLPAELHAMRVLGLVKT